MDRRHIRYRLHNSSHRHTDPSVHSYTSISKSQQRRTMHPYRSRVSDLRNPERPYRRLDSDPTFASCLETAGFNNAEGTVDIHLLYRRLVSIVSMHTDVAVLMVGSVCLCSIIRATQVLHMNTLDAPCKRHPILQVASMLIEKSGTDSMTVVWSLAEGGTAILCACLPTLRPLLRWMGRLEWSPKRNRLALHGFRIVEKTKDADAPSTRDVARADPRATV